MSCSTSATETVRQFVRHLAQPVPPHPDEPWSVQGVPISTTVNTNIGSNGKQPTTNASGSGHLATTNQFSQFLAFGAVTATTVTTVLTRMIRSSHTDQLRT